MNKNKKKEKNFSNVIKKQDTAAWADIHKELPDSKVPIPSLEQVINAKEWVDSNQK